MSSTPLHTLRVPEVFQALETSPAGLTSEEAARRLSLYGPNVLGEPAEVTPLWRKFFGYMAHPMGLLLCGAGLTAFLEGRPVLGCTIWGIVLINAAFSLWQEYRAEMAVATLKRVLPAHARVVRAGQESLVPAEEVVPGDLLVLAEGDRVPADARVVEERGLRANHATLTGDAVPVRKTAEASLREDMTELERPNLVFAGTSVAAGVGRAVVFATGMFTQLGRIARLSQTVKEPPSSIFREINRLTHVLALIAVAAGAVTFLVGLTDIGMELGGALLFAAGVVVAITPEGLLPTVTLSLAMAVQRLARRGVLVKKLAVVDTLGKTSVICTDKSGTLTQNQMMVCEVWVGGRRLHVSGAGYEPQGSFSPPSSAVLAGGDLLSLLIAAERCNNSRLMPPTPDRPRWGYLGDQTEAALLVLALKGGVDEQELERQYPRTHELPFDARRKRMSTIHRVGVGVGARDIVFVKGSPREVLQRCSHILADGQVSPLDSVTRAAILAVNDEYAGNTLRVLALARRELPPRTGGYDPDEVERELTFLGLAAMMDPPRPEVARAIQTCHEAGIRLVMVTGDYGLTAASLARRVGLLTTPHPQIITGADVESMSDAELQAALGEDAASSIVFARMAPEHKLRLVAAFQACGEVVAVIGDGVNDAPALRKSDIGIAMGASGADVSREAADVILTDDNFAAVVQAIAEGRAVYDNIRKFITYILASNVPEILPFALRAMFGIPIALTVPQILAVDMGTDLLPALALGMERPEPDVMRRPPRRRALSLIDRRLALRALWLGGIEAVLCYLGFFWVFRSAGYADFLNLPRVDLLPFTERLTTQAGWVYILATTVFHAGVVTAQVGNVFACRRAAAGDGWGWLRNRTLRVGIVVELALILLLVYVRPLADLFEHRPIPPAWWIGLALYAPILYGLDWVFKRMKREDVKREDVKRET